MKSLVYKNGIFFILVIAVILRLVAINQSLWLDEAIGALIVRDFSYSGIVSEFMQFDNHPPLYYLVLKFWVNIFGLSEVSFRSLSIIFGLGTILFTYKIAKKLNPFRDNFFPLFTALLITTSQFHIYYSHEARMYSMAAFWATLAIYSFLFLLKEGKNIAFWFLFSASFTAMVFTDYVPIFLFPVFPISAFLNGKKINWWLKFAASLIPLVLFGFFWIPLFLIQAEKGRWLLSTLPAWRQVAGGATIKQALLVWMKFVLGRISFPRKIYYYSLVFLASIPTLISGLSALTKKEKRFNLIVLWLITPLLLGYFASYWFPAFIYFRFLYVLPAFYLIISYGVSSFKFKPIRTTLAILLVGVNLVGWTIYMVDNGQQRENWRDAVSFVETNALDNEIVIFEYPEPFAPYRWYETTPNISFGATDSIASDPLKTAQLTKAITNNKHGVFYFEYLRDLSDPQRVVEETLKGEGFGVKEIVSFVGVGQVYYYTR